MPFILIDKPAGITSHGVVSRLRRLTGEKKIGHAGTLDPFATGLLLVGITREATKQLDRFLKQDKSYITTAQLGATSTTDDPEGDITTVAVDTPPDEKTITEVLRTFVGQQQQVPPDFAAKKIGGKKMYELARAGTPVAAKAHPVVIHEIQLVNYTYPELTFAVSCGSGTYIRALARDIGRALGTGAYLTELRRTKIGDYNVDDAIELEKLTAENWQGYTFE